MSYSDWNEPGPTRRPRRQYAGGFRWLVLLLVVAAAVVIWVQWGGWQRGPLHDPDAVPRPVVARGELAADEQATIALFKSASPAVVFITTAALRRDLFSLNVHEIPQGTGSGFVWSKDGYIVTNYHVIQDAQVAHVTLSDQSTWTARLVGYEADKDLAVLKIDAPAERLYPILVGASSDLQVGQKVFAIGNPFGLDQTLTTGVISGLGREILSVTRRPITGVIQTDAAINPGNSGGPLLDSAGRLIGVNTAIFSPSGAYAGIGFAVPVDTVNRLVPQLIAHGRVPRPGIGIHLADDHLVRRLGLDGVLVLRVVPGSPADEAGIRPTRQRADGRMELGDVIVGLDGKRVRTTDDLLRLLDGYRVGDEVQLEVNRNGEVVEVPIVLRSLEG